MSPDRLSRVEELYHAARERQTPEREAFLIAACKGDEQLQREVESLLEQQSGSLLDGPAVRSLRAIRSLRVLCWAPTRFRTCSDREAWARSTVPTIRGSAGTLP
jgi:hypothetical protein